MTTCCPGDAVTMTGVSVNQRRLLDSSSLSSEDTEQYIWAKHTDICVWSCHNETQSFFKLFLLFSYTCVYISPYVCYACACVLGGQKRGMRFSSTESQVNELFVCLCVEFSAPIILKSSKCSWPPWHLSSPENHEFICWYLKNTNKIWSWECSSVGRVLT